MRIEQIGIASSALGLLLIVAAMFWPSFDNGRTQWTDEDAQVYQETVARAHVGAHLEAQAGSRANVYQREPVDPERLLQHREDVKALKELKAKLDGARNRPLRIAGILKWGGMGLVVTGVVVVFAGRSRAG